MKKDIYIIKNKINNKVYVGQAINPEHRWEQYESAVRKGYNNQVILKAMTKYGIENFWMEILESQVENYDEREIYWIKKLNSLIPNGYNVAKGGQGTGAGIEAYGAKIKDEQILKDIVEDIITSNMTLITISKKYNISYGMVNEINQGHTYRNNNLHYPLRESNKFSKDKLNQITYALKYELDKSLKDISEEYNVNHNFLNDINQGKSYYRDYLTYPIRKFKMKKAEEDYPLIKDLLINTTIPQKEIAKKFNRSQGTISAINLGKRGYDKNLTYPLRDNVVLKNTCISPDLLLEIEKDIKENLLSLKKIAQKYELPVSTICNINSGKIKKYFKETNIYPLRKK